MGKHGPVPPEIRRRNWTEQNGICPWCWEPLKLIEAVPHHWLIKQNVYTLPAYIIHHPYNIVMLHDQPCHQVHGQTAEMTAEILRYKQDYMGLNIYGWILGLYESGRLKHWPEGLPKNRLEESIK